MANSRRTNHASFSMHSHHTVVSHPVIIICVNTHFSPTLVARFLWEKIDLYKRKPTNQSRTRSTKIISLQEAKETSTIKHTPQSSNRYIFKPSPTTPVNTNKKEVPEGYQNRRNLFQGNGTAQSFSPFSTTFKLSEHSANYIRLVHHSSNCLLHRFTRTSGIYYCRLESSPVNFPYRCSTSSQSHTHCPAH
jgi:hypothetical protein